MRYLLTLSVFLLTFAGHSQDSTQNWPRRMLFGAGIGLTQKAEIDVNVELALIKSKPKLYVSLIADAFTAKRVPKRRWTTAQIGGRLNYVLIRQSQAHRLLLFGSGKYATQGNEKPEGLKDWFWEAGSSYLYKIPTRLQGEPWLKVNISYENILNGRLFCSIGIQTII